MIIIKKGKQFLKGLDVFGEPIIFNIDGRVIYKSAIGGIVTIFMIISIAFMFQTQILNFFEKVKLTVRQNQEYTTQPIYIEMNHENFLFAVKVKQPNEYPYIEKPFYIIQVKQHISTYNKEVRSKQLQMEPCTLERLLKFSQGNKDTLENLYQDFELGGFLCPPENFNLSLQGAPNTALYSYVTIEVTECQNDSSSKDNWGYTCAPQKIIDDYYEEWGSFKVTVYTSNYVVNPSAQVDFYQLFLAQDLEFEIQVLAQFHQKPGKTQQTVYAQHRKYTVYTDLSLFIDQENQKVELVMRDAGSVSSQTVLSVTEKSKQIPLKIFLTSGYYNFQAFRRFQKIDELLSYFGGIFNLFIVVFGVFMKYYNQTYFKLHLANKLYDFKSIPKGLQRKLADDMDLAESSPLQTTSREIPNDKFERIMQLQRKKLTLKDVCNLKKLQLVGFKDRIEFLLWIFHAALGKNRKLKFTLSYMVYTILCRKTQKNPQNRLIDKAIEQIEEDMNIKHIVNQMIQVEKMKSLIMTKPQMQLFNYFHKPQIESDHHKSLQQAQTRNFKQQAQSHDIGNRLDDQKFRSLIEAYRIINANPTTKNKKLMYFLGADLRRVIKTSILVEKVDHVDLEAHKYHSERHMEEEFLQDQMEIDQIKQIFTRYGSDKQRSSKIIQFDEEL